MSDRGSGSPAVSVQRLVKRYGERIAVDDVTFEVAHGETVALLGPNGAGKSTTVEILEGYRRRDAGTVRVLGTDPAGGGLDWKARIGVVLQSTGDAGSARAREQLAHFAAFYPAPRDVDEVLDAVGLASAARQPVRALSGGQRRRLDVALGIIGRPELLFLDEPTTGFDPEARHRFWGLIRRLKREGTTILLTTHDLDEAAALSDRAAVIAGGRLVDVGPADRIGSAGARIPLVRWRDARGVHEQRTKDPGRLVASLVATGGEPDALEVVRPSLEEVYLDLLRSHRSREEQPA
ncbi:ABC transporter ATP-binding protein [Amnibacterium sp. CER49]|uniref:ABC transporter ATP-binding protein n=1 Tax=Amnibacterium sp. CER49 TaxID=3039161 RepID=UPI002447A2A9|nr:ABC transporter ATP-binding protein [Amnibacterium sp. CER49]MDH2442634.1 ABC transporter ATP-binding protein [Amnibacterium sp. CER49]